MLLLQNILYCLLFILMVKCLVRNLQSYLFLVVMNWFDGIMLDRVWVGHSKIWEIKGMEGIPYIKPWKTVLTKRGLATILYLIIALVTAGIVVLVGKIC